MSLKDYVLNEKGELCHPSRLGAVLPTKPEQDPLPALDHSKKDNSRGARKVVLRVTIIRRGRRIMDSDENLPFAYKGLKDAIAHTLGYDDNDKQIEWRYEQIIGKPHGTIVMFTI